tara:strand:+ start:1391 stop:2224 length:834 start_codon:yes stop_codon:yes gene_type:complete
MAEIYNLYGGAAANPNNTKKGNNNGKKNNANNNSNNNANNNANNNSNNNNANNNNANNNNANNNNANNNNANNNNSISSILNGIRFNKDKKVIIFWICWMVVVILLLTTYIKTPIRYSEEDAFYKTPYNLVYYYLYLLLLISVCYYGYTIAPRMPLIRDDDLYFKMIPMIVLGLSIVVINIYDSPTLKEDGSFKSSPSFITTKKRNLIIILIILLLTSISLVVLDIMKSAKSFNKFKPSHLYRAWCGFIVIFGVSYLLYNKVGYSVRKYKLPDTWMK